MDDNCIIVLVYMVDPEQKIFICMDLAVQYYGYHHTSYKCVFNILAACMYMYAQCHSKFPLQHI
jgi:hypothetical protein